jgi:NADPH-dependent 2,4-dienoyl-CoA reductase/sulfur reductase-like enzyme
MSVHRVNAVSDLEEIYDLLVVGAGPAGLSAAATAAEYGLSVLLCDENGSPGGQIYRGITEASAATKARLGKDYAAGAGLVTRFLASSAHYAARASVWSIAPHEPEVGEASGLEVGISLAGAARMIQARRAVLATGALERPFPIPGWTLPGVMTAGSAQIALKTAGLVPSGRTVIAGTGPLLYLLAAQLIGAGASVIAVIDTTPNGNKRRALPHAFDFARSAYGLKGARLLAQVHRHARVIRNVIALEAAGDGGLTEVVVTHRGGTERLPADLLLLHQGIVPNLNLSLASGCASGWNERQATFTPTADEWCQTSMPDIAIAGDAGGIIGAEGSALHGALAGMAAAWRLGRLSEAERDKRAAPVRARLRTALRGRPFIDELFRPGDDFRIPARPETIVCRCEEVTAGAIRATMPLGVRGPNQMKAYLRCGMGPCQGRLCGLTVTEIIAQERGVAPGEVGYYNVRTPIKPVTLKELAALPQSDSAIKAVAGFIEKPVSASHSQSRG